MPAAANAKKVKGRRSPSQHSGKGYAVHHIHFSPLTLSATINLSLKRYQKLQTYTKNRRRATGTYAFFTIYEDPDCREPAELLVGENAPPTGDALRAISPESSFSPWTWDYQQACLITKRAMERSMYVAVESSHLPSDKIGHSPHPLPIGQALAEFADAGSNLPLLHLLT